jgi:hypothetical protein
MELKEGHSYIFKNQNSIYPTKGTILEITKKTYLIRWESGAKIRVFINEFDRETKLIEELGQIKSLDYSKLQKFLNQWIKIFYWNGQKKTENYLKK